MAAFVTLVGLLNFALGYFLALALADPPFWVLLKGNSLPNLGRRIKHLLNRSTVGNTAIEAEPEEPDPQDAMHAACTLVTISQLPELWQQALRDDGLQPASLASGAGHFLCLEGTIYREHLVTAEARARQARVVQNPLATEQLAADLRFINVDWSHKQRQAAELLEEHVGKLGPAEAQACQLARLLRGHEAHIADIDREVQSLNFRADGTVACRRMLGEMQQLIQLAHSFRDATQISLAAIYRHEASLDKLDRKLHYDALTGLLGRLGIEALFAQEFPGESRPTAALRITLDNLGKVNQRLGARAGDQVLKSIARFAAELAVESREKRMIARLTGSEFLLLANDATVEGLTAIGEQIRQSFEAAVFSYQGTEFSLSLTISVAAISTDAGLSDVIRRLDVVREVALRAGRNRSARWENGEAILTLPPAIPVPARMIVVDTAA